MYECIIMIVRNAFISFKTLFSFLEFENFFEKRLNTDNQKNYVFIKLQVGALIITKMVYGQISESVLWADIDESLYCQTSCSNYFTGSSKKGQSTVVYAKNETINIGDNQIFSVF